jgi:hypothetical protein
MDDLFLLFLRLVLIVSGFLFGVFTSIHLVKWIEKQLSFPFLMLFASLIVLASTTAGRTATLLGWFAGLCWAYYPQCRVGTIEKAMAWIQIVTGAVIAVLGIVMVPDNFVILFCLLAWATSALATGALILRNKPLVLIEAAKPTPPEAVYENEIRTIN